jgi:glycosyltransferase involved in cell wall biosynthesis
MRIIYANKYFFRNGGSEVVMFDEMSIMNSMGIDVVHFAMTDDRNFPSSFSDYFVTPKSYRSRSMAARWRSALSFVHSPEAVRNLSALIRATKPDILHCHNIYHQLTPSIISAADRLGVPVVLTLHDLKAVCPVYTQVRDGQPCSKCSPTRFESVLRHRCGGHSFQNRLLLWAEARFHQAAGSYEQVRKFIAPSRFVRDAVGARFPAVRIEHIPNGIDLSGIEPASSDGEFVLYFGRIAADKGVETLLRAHSEDHHSWRLVLAGTGPSMQEYKDRYPEAEFLGFLNGQELRKCIGKAALVVVPSEVQENCSLSIIEAMAHGKAVVASRIGGNPELVRDGTTGLLFRPKDRRDLSKQVHQLLHHPDLRIRFGRAGRKVAEEEYSLAVHGRKLLALYQTVAGRQTSATDRHEWQKSIAS